MDSAFLLNSFLFTVVYLIIGYGAGRLVIDKGVKVNYTRKINHFGLFFIPLIIDQIVPYEVTPATGLVRLALMLSFLGVMIEPIRDRIRLIEVVYISYDRPEDRPHTMVWLLTQLATGFLVVIGLQVYMAQYQLEALIFIPTIVNVFGDGLAEPVGVRFGKHTYRTKALFTDKLYTRSYEGSAMVWGATVVAILMMAPFFSSFGLVVALVVMPVVMALTEAFSPHTWDTPFIFLVGGILSIICVGL
ncbi:MAG TPA: hypothetical protein VLL52_10490 [Anaerolineae bacterium]|nr:hypothetical protein [Anaerolineae bacterium]